MLLNALFVLEIFKFFALTLDYVKKRLNKKAIFDFKIYDVTDWTTNNYDPHITQYLQR